MSEMELLLHTQEITLSYIYKLKRLIQKGGNIGTMTSRLHNELQLALQGINTAEKN